MEPIDWTNPAVLARRLIRRLDRLRLGLDIKSYSERAYWKDDIPRFIAWYRGELPELYGHPSPPPEKKVKTGNLVERAICTMVNTTLEKDRRYLDALALPADAFAGKTVVDIGCGPMGSVLLFEDANIIGVDPLVNVYRAIGYPIDAYSERLSYLACRAEQINLPNASVDAVISVNAIDHVDNFEECAKEIKRILKPGGKVRFEVHYHEARVCEPHELNDQRMLDCYGDIGIAKVRVRQFGTDVVYTKELEGEYLVTWGN
jgi:ubiquinone/menaquinone biosynthesis C-methylase UbiE